ncbi:hypothetical protein J3Q64DRAFT_1853004 [Phycomyces blakesleeanus]|uniref:NTF2 domain-containing protein n=1 Tax=Phycomyces blakesleeanus TaxID=4837 RepID=A0ABR3AK87_PHYBL
MTATVSQPTQTHLKSGKESPALSDLASQDVGLLFVREYYTFLNKKPHRLHAFYNNDSYFLRGDEGESVQAYHGQEEIRKKIEELNFEGCKVLVTQVDTQMSVSNGILIQVLGEMSNKDGSSQKFSQTFFLATQHKGYYVLNDIFRFLKDEVNIDYYTCDEEEEVATTPVPTVTPTSTATTTETPTEIETPSPTFLNASTPTPTPTSTVASPPTFTPVPSAAPTPTPSSVPVPSSVPLTATVPVAGPSAVAAENPVESLIAEKGVEKVEDTLGTPDIDELKENNEFFKKKSTLKESKKVKNDTRKSTETPKHHKSVKPHTPQKTWATLTANDAKRWGLSSNDKETLTEEQQHEKMVQKQQQQQSLPASIFTDVKESPQETSLAASAQQSQPVLEGAFKEQQQRPEESNQIFIKGVKTGMTDDQLKDAFAQFGPVQQLRVSIPKHCAFLDFVTADAAQKAIAQHKISVCGMIVLAEVRRPLNSRPPYPRSQNGGQFDRRFPSNRRGGYRGSSRPLSNDPKQQHQQTQTQTQTQIQQQQQHRHQPTSPVSKIE